MKTPYESPLCTAVRLTPQALLCTSTESEQFKPDAEVFPW